jgi:predicted amidohydrolase YtcJ
MQKLAVSGALALALVAGSAGAKAPLAADMVLHHGTILTVDAKDRVVQAMAIRGGRIVALGSDKAVRAYIGKRTKVIDLAGRTATPGMIDAHAHALGGGIDEVANLQLGEASSVADFLARVKARAAELPPGAWVTGSGWNESRIAEHRPPSLAELDAVSAGHPVALGNTTGHYTLVNSAVLVLAGITAATPDPAGGRYDKDASGALNGVLYDSAQDVLDKLVPPVDAATRDKGLKHLIEGALAEGLTGFKDPGIDRVGWDVYARAAKAAPLPIHACTLVSARTDMMTARAAVDDYRQRKQEVAAMKGRNLDVCGVKIFLDGSGAGRTAWMYKPFETDASHANPGTGFPMMATESYRAMVTLFTKAGIPIGTHAIGDRAIDTVVDAYADALKAAPKVGLRHSLIHANLPTEHAIDVMAELQKTYDAGYPEAQAEFLWFLGDALAAGWGPERSQKMMPYATYVKRGVLYSDGSDYPVTPYAPRYGLWSSVAREPDGDRFGKAPFGTAEAVDIHTAMKSHTIWAARQLFLEKQTGSLEVGKLADVAVWDRNPYAVPTAVLKDMRCMMTLFGGKVVFERK